MNHKSDVTKTSVCNCVDTSPVWLGDCIVQYVNSLSLEAKQFMSHITFWKLSQSCLYNGGSGMPTSFGQALILAHTLYNPKTNFAEFSFPVPQLSFYSNVSKQTVTFAYSQTPTTPYPGIHLTVRKDLPVIKKLRLSQVNYQPSQRNRMNDNACSIS